MTATVTAATNMAANVFVIQRRWTTGNGTTDVFAAIATPTQLEDLPVNAPTDTVGFFLSNTVDLVARTAQELDNVFEEMLAELKNLTADVTVLNTSLSPDTTYVITPSSVAYTSLAGKTHYITPVFSSPGAVASTVLGWSTPLISDPDGVGYDYVYNMSVDPALSTLFPIDSGLVAFASFLQQGVARTANGYKLTTSGLYWKTLSTNDVPWEVPITQSVSYYSTVLKLQLSFYK